MENEPEETIEAIRSGEVDGLVVRRPSGYQILTLKDANQTYQKFFDRMEEGALGITADGSLLYCNPCFIEMIEANPSRIIVSSIYDFIDEDDRDVLREMLATCEDKARGEFFMVSQSGKRFPALISISSLDFENIKTFCLVVTDLTSQKMNEHLRGFVSFAAHDLRGPLVNINAFATLLFKRISERLDDRERDLFNRLIKLSVRAERLLEDLLAYSRTSDPKHLMHDVDLNKVFRQAIEDIDIKIAEKRAEITVDPMPIVVGNISQLRQLVQNLFSNSLKYSRPGIAPRIKVSSRIRGDDVEITIEDNGIGFEQQYAERIFEPFERLHGKDEYDGSGVGLSICKKICENHGGVIEATGRPGEGASFRFTLKLGTSH